MGGSAKRAPPLLNRIINPWPFSAGRPPRRRLVLVSTSQGVAGHLTQKKNNTLMNHISHYLLKPGAMASLALLTAASPSVAQNRAVASHQISLLGEFRPIGGSGNNLKDPSLNAIPGNAELALAPPNFAPIGERSERQDDQ